MIVTDRDKLKSWAGLVCLFNKWSIMQTNLPCKQIEKTGNVATSPPPPKKTTDQKHPRDRDRSNEGKRRKKRGEKKQKKVVLLIVPLPKRCKASKNRLKAPHHP